MSANDTQFFKQSLRSEYWINFNVDKKFSLAGVDEPELDSEDKELVRTWASTKGATKTAPGQTQSSSLYRPILDPFEIRVLEILPGTGDDRLRGRLRHCSLELQARFALAVDGSATPIVYTALSYTWGPNAFDEAIECEGHVKNITKSLAVALRAFRQEDRSVVMWIDQICINQDDNEEKAQQIPLMSRIYQNAMNTVIWLGESTSNSASAIKLLEDARLLLQFTEKTIGPDEFEGLNLPSESSEVWKALWDFLSRPWFTRLWIIQEVILSFDSWVVCGNHMATWDVLSLACLHLWTCGISRWLGEKFNSGSRALDHQRDLCESVQHLSSMKSSYHSTAMPLFDLLIESREAKCYDNRDKVYGLLGVCQDQDRSAIRPSYADEFPVTHLYRDITIRHLDNNKGSLRLGVVLTCVDHESIDLPSWVPDWRNPRRTHSLGHSTTTTTPYMACGHLTIEIGRVHPPLERKNKDELRLHGVSVDAIAKVSTVFTNPELSLEDPITANGDLKDMCSFVAELQEYPGNETVFSAFWQTLVAGKDATEMAKAPIAYEEIISLLLDASTGLSPSLPGQTYSARQRKTFQDVRTSMMHAMRNRRLCFTAKGYLGLVSETSKVGDEIHILDGCHVPYLLRKVEGRRHRLVGECYVHGIMRGEAVQDGQSMDEIVLMNFMQTMASSQGLIELLSASMVEPSLVVFSPAETQAPCSFPYKSQAVITFCLHPSLHAIANLISSNHLHHSQHLWNSSFSYPNGKTQTQFESSSRAKKHRVSIWLSQERFEHPQLPKLGVADILEEVLTCRQEQENPIILPSIEFSPAVKVESSPHVVPLSSSPHNPPAEASAIDNAPSEASPVFDQLAQASSVIAPPVHFHHPGIPPVRAFAPLDQNPPLINAVDRTPSAVNPRPVIEARALNPPAVLPPLPTRRGNAPPTQPGPSIPQIADPSHVGNPPPPNPGPRGRYSFQGLMDICQGMEAEILSNALGNTKARGDEGSFKTPLEYAVIRRIKTTMMVNRHTAVAEQTRIEDDFRKLSGQEQSRPIMKMSGSLNDMMRGFDR
ncbi:uncharacterized protein CLUP02_07285 [Colletotrichum lupini]|uniref:Heterokaryon incompatibility domain-containing protein n=1 Tax=Colletotrichum lupini TaxID=145971 RepID=A0A9Q8SQQ1_9PEZI|nr:uncharacterized protein CLUP02_07285 [Colletotrichum lupini]UQC81799.1 hypothetical protein CLUP02_07285 [Colletotrichum lupini]